jgi:hypothetical protein
LSSARARAEGLVEQPVSYPAALFIVAVWLAFLASALWLVVTALPA